jgi:hypothetical protein
MTRAQRTIFIFGAIAILAALLFPPWVTEGGSKGYHFLFSGVSYRINTSLLFIQVASIAVITLFVYFAAKSRA